MTKSGEIDWGALERSLVEQGIIVSRLHNRDGRFLCTLPINIQIEIFRQILKTFSTHAIYEPDNDGFVIYADSDVGTQREERPPVQGTVTFIYPKRRRRSDL